jgi:hypothetical protein
MGWMLSRFIDDALHDLETANPPLCQTIPLQSSVPGGRAITAIKLSNPEPKDRIPVLFTGGTHGREWAPPDALVGFVQRLVTARANEVDIVYPAFTTGGVTYSDPNYRIPRADVLDIFDRFTVIVLPVVNPDGRDFTLLGSKPLNLPDVVNEVLWRKNRRDVRTDQEQIALPATSVGIDLNRNFPIAWEPSDYYNPQAAKNVNGSTNKGDRNYKGPSQGSEIETQNVMNLVNEYKVRAFVDVHLSGRNIFYPYAIEKNQTTNPVLRFDEAGFNHLPALPTSGRDGMLGDAYGEYVPPDLLNRLIAVANAMSAEILVSAGASPVAQARSRYKVCQTVESSRFDGANPNVTFIGGADDWVFSRQFADGDMPECVSYTLEAGLALGQRNQARDPTDVNPLDEDGEFFPDFDKQRPKVEREIHAALFGLLKAL